MMEWLKKLLGNSNDAEVKKLSKIVDQVEALEGEYKQLTDEQLRAKTRAECEVQRAEAEAKRICENLIRNAMLRAQSMTHRPPEG